MFEALCPRIRCSGIRTRASSLRIQTKKRTPSDRSFLERPTFLKILQVARIELALKCLQETVGAADAQWGYGTKYDTKFGTACSALSYPTCIAPATTRGNPLRRTRTQLRLRYGTRSIPPRSLQMSERRCRKQRTERTTNASRQRS